MKEKDYLSTRTEIDILEKVSHPNIIKYFCKMEDFDSVYIIMEYIQAETLYDFVLRSDEIPEMLVKLLFNSIVSGLTYLHSLGIIHRDLKAENILITEKGDVRIIDFGLSKIMSSSENSNEGVGTVNYVAPEVLVRQNYTNKVDVWSLGIVLYFMLSKRLPFDDISQKDELIAMNIVQKEIFFPKAFWEKRSIESRILISSCLNKSQTKRLLVKHVSIHPWFKELTF